MIALAQLDSQRNGNAPIYPPSSNFLRKEDVSAPRRSPVVAVETTTPRESTRKASAAAMCDALATRFSAGAPEPARCCPPVLLIVTIVALIILWTQGHAPALPQQMRTSKAVICPACPTPASQVEAASLPLSPCPLPLSPPSPSLSPSPPPAFFAAVCVTGQIRTLTMHSNHSKYPLSWLPQRNRPRPPAEELSNMTVAESVQARFYPAMSGPGSDFDVFMVVATRGGPKEPAVGDTNACEPLRPPARTDGGRTRHLHCDIYAEDSAPVRMWGDMPMPGEIWAPGAVSPVWRQYTLPSRELQFTQQLYDLWRCMEAVRLRELRTGVRYTHVVRTRPDVAWYEPLSVPLSDLDYGTADAPVVRSTASSACCCGNDDWFNVGTRDVMGRFLDRFLYLNSLKHSIFDSPWTAENYARTALAPINGVIGEDARLTACLLKPSDRYLPGEP